MITKIEKLIEQLIEPLKKDTLAFYVMALKGAKNLYGENMDKLIEDKGFNRYDLYRRGSEANKAKKQLIEEYGLDLYNLGVSLFHEDLENLVNKEFNLKKERMLIQINKKLLKEDKLIDIEVYTGSQGYLNATLILNTHTIQIETIIASGIVQKPHYRTLVKRTKL